MPSPLTITTADDAAALLRDSPLPLVDYGVAHRGVGHPPPPPDQRLDAELRGGVIEHHVDDLTVCAAAGTPLGQLQQALAPAGQFLPVDGDDDMTLGELVNHHVWGPLRVGYGSIRELLLGLAYVDGRGELVRVGGRTVKNVAGLDVTRLLVGSMGELGLIVEVTLRTYALPAVALAVDVQLPSPAALDRQMTALLCSDAAPARLAVAEEEGRWLARVAYFGDRATCTAQLHALGEQVEAVPGARTVGVGEVAPPAYLAQRAVHRAWRRSAAAVAKVMVPPAETGTVALQLKEVDATLQVGLAPAHGQLFVGGALDAAGAARLHAAIVRAVEPVGGYVVWHARPAGAAVPPWWPPRPDLPLLLRIKRALDPRNRFNPGRFLVEPSRA